MKIEERELFEYYKKRVMDNIFNKPGLYQDIKELEDFIKLVEFTEEALTNQDKFCDYIANSLNEKEQEIKALSRKLKIMTNIACQTMKDLNNLTGSLIDDNLHKLNRVQFAQYCKQLDFIEGEVKSYKR